MPWGSLGVDNSVSGRQGPEDQAVSDQPPKKSNELEIVIAVLVLILLGIIGYSMSGASWSSRPSDAAPSRFE